MEQNRAIRGILYGLFLSGIFWTLVLIAALAPQVTAAL